MRKNPFNSFLVAIAICDLTLMGSYLLFKRVRCRFTHFFPYFFYRETFADRHMQSDIFHIRVYTYNNVSLLKR